MKRKKLWLRLGALVLSLVMLVTAVGALSYDFSGDGKTNVWDLQLAVNQNKSAAEQTAALKEALGGGDELHKNASGKWEIWSATGLYNMANHASAGDTYVLMADIDLGGRDWTPIDNFEGILDGNGHTISNFKITKCGADTSMGFFSVIDYDKDKIQSVVKNLHLRDVELTATENAMYIGLLAGSNRGKVQNCTTVGVVNDNRTTLPGNVRIGTLVGRNNNSNPDGTISGSNSLTVLDTCTTYTHTQKVSSMMATNFAELSYPEGTATDKQYKRYTGVVGYSKEANIDKTLLWQDITNSTTLTSETMQQRRETVARAMYDICTVEWRPSQTMTLHWYKNNHDYYTSVYEAGKLYRGIPYNHGSSSLNRFNAFINDPNLPTEAYYLTDNNVVAAINEAGAGKTITATTQQGKTVTLKTPDDWDNSKNADGAYVNKNTGTYVTGFARYVGNDCSSAATWAWRKVSASYGTGYANPTSTSNMFPTEVYMMGGTGSTGILPVNGLTFEHPTDTSTLGYSKTVNAVHNADNTVIPEALARASKGDFLMGYQVAGGHTRVMIGDAVAIRTWDGKLDVELSYVITCEQGASSSGVNAKGEEWSSSCRVDYKYTFAELVRYGKADNDGKCRYFPITCTALREDDTPAAVTSFTYKGGKAVTSNFHIEATIKDGVTTYTNTTLSGSRSRLCGPNVTDLYPDIQKGEQVTFVLSNGKTCTITYGTAYK